MLTEEERTQIPLGELIDREALKRFPEKLSNGEEDNVGELFRKLFIQGARWMADKLLDED